MACVETAGDVIAGDVAKFGEGGLCIILNDTMGDLSD